MNPAPVSKRRVGLKPDELHQVVVVSDVRVSADEKWIAAVASRADPESNGYHSTIWRIAVDGSEPPRALIREGRGDADPRWGPQGHLAFTSRGTTNARQLYVLNPSDATAKQLTVLDEDVTEPTWSPDGRHLAFTQRVRDPIFDEPDPRRRPPRRLTKLQFRFERVGWLAGRHRQIFVVPVDGSRPPRQLTYGPYESLHPTWAPDGTRIAFASARHEDWDIQQVRDVYTVPFSGGPVTRVTDCDAWYEAPSWSPDGAFLACRYHRGGFEYPYFTQIAVIDSASHAVALVTESLDMNCGPTPELREPIWFECQLLFAVETFGNTHLYSVDPRSSEPPRLMVGGKCTVTSYDIRGSTLAYALTTATAPAEVCVGGKRLTSFNKQLRDRLIQPEQFVVTATDGALIDAWLVRPAYFDTSQVYPVLLSIHGGPLIQYGNRFFDEFQILANAGFVVLYSNPRGSIGYGEEWARAIRPMSQGGTGWGARDFLDLMDVVDEALRRFPFCDANRIGVMGGSYGGFLTSWIIGHTERFHAACTERSINNLQSYFGSSDMGWIFKTYLGAFPFEDEQLYRTMSPVTYAAEMQTPLLIIHSEDDARSDIEQAQYLFTALRLLKRDVEFVRFSGEGHELSRSGSPVHRAMRFEAIIEWFTRKMPPEAPRAGSSAIVPH